MSEFTKESPCTIRSKDTAVNRCEKAYWLLLGVQMIADQIAEENLNEFSPEDAAEAIKQIVSCIAEQIISVQLAMMDIPTCRKEDIA